MPSIEYLYFFLWWLAVTLVGWAAWPVAATLLHGLPDRGYALARTLGLLLAGYTFWLLTTLGFLQNHPGGILLTFAGLAGLGAWAASRLGWGELRAWVSANRALLLGYEAIFFLAFALWAIVRAYNPQLMSAGGEKWMEYAFLNAISRSPNFPPLDPWLAGFAISYYYFGYVIVASLAKATFVPLSHGFNLGIALLYALTALGVTGIVFNLISLTKGALEKGGAGSPARSSSAVEAAAGESRKGWRSEKASARGKSTPAAASLGARGLLPALLGFVLVLGVGNFEGVWEALHAKGWGSRDFWCRLDIHNLTDAPATGSFTPNDNYWWWRASRTVNDRALGPEGEPGGPCGTGAHVEVIDEFPFFSFMLGDMHPHVLALPFAFLALGLGLSLCVRPDEGPTVAGMKLPVDAARLAFGALALGGLSFLNTWDFPIYLFVVTLAFLIGRVRQAGWQRPTWIETGRLALTLAIGGVLLYLPFYTGFSSQASGILPNLAFPTKLQQFVTMFGPVLLVVIAFLAWILYTQRRAVNWRTFIGVTLGASLGLFVFSLLLSVVLLQVPALRGRVEEVIAPLSWNEALSQVMNRRLVYSGTALWLAAILGGVVALVVSKRESEAGEAGPGVGLRQPPLSFTLILLGTGTLLALGPEFVYLHDLFGTRMNTVFKFYYQAWALWGTAGAFAVWYAFTHASNLGRWLTGIGLSVVIALGAVYPLLALPSKTNYFAGPATLDSTIEFAQYNPEDMQAIQWIKANLKDNAVVLEGVGGSYSDFGRISGFTGMPTVIGWGWHEVQWRGRTADPVTRGREADVETIYTSPDWAITEQLLDQYGVEYVYVGSMERNQYGLDSLRKFDEHMWPIYTSDSVIIYQRMKPEVAR